jgi:hypothetical protein
MSSNYQYDKHNHLVKQNEIISEDEQRQELLFKFKILKKSYPTANIPEFSEQSDLANMISIYESTIQKIFLNTTIDCIYDLISRKIFPSK